MLWSAKSVTQLGVHPESMDGVLGELKMLIIVFLLNVSTALGHSLAELGWLELTIAVVDLDLFCVIDLLNHQALLTLWTLLPYGEVFPCH